MSDSKKIKDICGSDEQFNDIFTTKVKITRPQDIIKRRKEKDLRKAQRKNQKVVENVMTIDDVKPIKRPKEINLIDISDNSASNNKYTDSKCDRLLEEIEREFFTIDSPPPVKIPRTDNNCQFIGIEENEKLITTCFGLNDVSINEPESPALKFNIRITWKTITFKFLVDESYNIGKIKSLLAKKVKVSADQFALFTNETDKLTEDNKKTLKELGIRDSGFKLQALQKSTTKETYEEIKLPENIQDPNKIKLKFQGGTGERRDKATILLVNKNDTFKIILQKYAQEKQLIDSDKIRFKFDGEAIGLNETPNSLDFEEEECIDVHILP